MILGLSGPFFYLKKYHNLEILPCHPRKDDVLKKYHDTLYDPFKFFFSLMS
jgi:hypothetical protein